MITTTTDGLTEDGRKVFVPYQSHVEVLYPCADQDGWNGEIMVRFQGREIAVPRHALRL